jgi:hypothetical protein
MASCQRTKDYVAKRTAEGKSKREIMRCLKRYAAREIYRQITNPLHSLIQDFGSFLGQPSAVVHREGRRF